MQCSNVYMNFENIMIRGLELCIWMEFCVDKLIIDVDCFIEINYAYLIILKLNQIIREC